MTDTKTTADTWTSGRLVHAPGLPCNPVDAKGRKRKKGLWTSTTDITCPVCKASK